MAALPSMRKELLKDFILHLRECIQTIFERLQSSDDGSYLEGSDEGSDQGSPRPDEGWDGGSQGSDEGWDEGLPRPDGGSDEESDEDEDEVILYQATNPIQSS